LRDGHEVLTIAPLELDDGLRIGQAVGRFLFLCNRTALTAELERREAVTVQRRGHVRAGRIERRPYRPADLAVLFHSPADEARAGGEDEVAGQPSPHEMKVVARAPHVLPGTRDQVCLLPRVVRGGASCSTYV
jgi:hypothetical protein